jgi:glycosyltransferase involved in cell wall biosynthesis
MLIGIDASRATGAHRTGTETYSLRLIRALLALPSPHRFRLYTNGAASAGLFSDGAAPANVELRAIPFPRLWTHLRLSAEMLLRPPDVLFVPAHVLPLLHPRRCVATVHDLGYLYYPEAHRPADRRYLAWSTAWTARFSTLVLADSEATRNDLVRAYHIDPGRVRVVYLGLAEVAASRPLLAGAEEEPRSACPYFLYVGTLQPRKNLERVVAAFARLAALPELEGVQLVLAGRRGWLYDGLFAQVNALGLAGRVLFPGYVAEGDLPSLYAGALAFVFPSLYEGFGLPVLEAHAYGVPVLTANNSSLPEVAGDAALLVDPHDVDAIAAAMHRLATDAALRQDLIRKGLENVKRFSWEKCARETLAVLEEAGRN